MTETQADYAENPRAVPGDNQPPEPIDPIKPFADRAETLVKACDVWLKSIPEVKDVAGRPVRELPDEATASACEDFFAQVRKAETAIDTARKAVNEPHNTAIKANNVAYGLLATKVNTIRILLQPLRDGWGRKVQAAQDAERERLAKEAETARRAAAEAAKAAEQPKTVADVVRADETAAVAVAAAERAEQAQTARPQVRGAFTTRASSLRTVYSAEITDWDKAVAHYKDTPEVRAAVQLLANADARALKHALVVPGVTVKDEQRMV